MNQLFIKCDTVQFIKIIIWKEENYMMDSKQLLINVFLNRQCKLKDSVEVMTYAILKCTIWHWAGLMPA